LSKQVRKNTGRGSCLASNKQIIARVLTVADSTGDVYPSEPVSYLPVSGIQ
jgi:hypothetical protein